MDFGRSFFRLLAPLFLSLSGCSFVDDQSLATLEMKAYANPSPVGGSEGNPRHQVVVAVLDTGVDYNHPLLQSKIHWDLDPAGRISGTGWDYLGKDSWPSPYIVRTAYRYPKLDAHDRRLAHERETEWMTGAARLLEFAPDLAPFVEPFEDFEKEDEAGIYHGTHVAGLAAYDDERIGILPFRILPQVESAKGGLSSNADLFKNIEDAVTRAKNSGAKIINLSIGMVFEKSDPAFKKLKPIFDRFGEFVRRNGDLIFVAAAGNEGRRIDGEKSFSMPCGIEAKNLLCVASLGAAGKPSDFSNIPAVRTPLVFALGEEILSTMPTRYCMAEAKRFIHQAGDGFYEKVLPRKKQEVLERKRAEQVQYIAKQMREECLKKDSSLAPFSGTSMATPIVARLLAEEILNGGSGSGAEVIARLLGRSERASHGGLEIRRLRAPKPSWYKGSGGVLFSPGSEESEFSFFIPVSGR